jgi:hypothetical protein
VFSSSQIRPPNLARRVDLFPLLSGLGSALCEESSGPCPSTASPPSIWIAIQISGPYDRTICSSGLIPQLCVQTTIIYMEASYWLLPPCSRLGLNGRPYRWSAIPSLIVLGWTIAVQFPAHVKLRRRPARGVLHGNPRVSESYRQIPAFPLTYGAVVGSGRGANMSARAMVLLFVEMATGRV